jgi:hypothetical protein
VKCQLTFSCVNIGYGKEQIMRKYILLWRDQDKPNQKEVAGVQTCPPPQQKQLLIK